MDEGERCTRIGYLYLGHLLALGAPKELKKMPGVTPPGTRRLEIISPDTAALLERLRTRPGVHEATIFRQAVHALGDAKLSPARPRSVSLVVRPRRPTVA